MAWHGLRCLRNEKIAWVHCKNFMKALRGNGLNVHKHNPTGSGIAVVLSGITVEHYIEHQHRLPMLCHGGPAGNDFNIYYRIVII